MNVNSTRLWESVHRLAEITEPGRPWTRRSFSPKFNEGRDWLIAEMERSGLNVAVDEAANVIGRLEGSSPNLPPLVIGSHTDTVPDGGRFDGIAGVLAGLEVARTLKEHNVQLARPLLIVDFTAEEPSEFGLSTVGSRAWSGTLTEEMLSYTDGGGRTLREALTYAGGHPEQIADARKTPGAFHQYFELHIEQGPVLLHEEADLGIVTGIVGIQRLNVSVTGTPNHAGTTPMTLRSDALAAASEMILALEYIAGGIYEEPVVGTAGEITNSPNASNVIPGTTDFLIEIRSISELVIDSVSETFRKRAQQIADRRGITVTFEDISRSKPITVDQDMRALLRKSAKAVTGRVIELPSGAGHDANQMSLITEVGMVFIPCLEGRSHCPEEWADEAALAQGAQTLLNAALESGS